MKLSTILLIFIFCAGKIFAQHQLYYFTTPDSSRVGVKDETGKIIIPATFYNTNYEFLKPITDSLIEFFGASDAPYNGPESPVIAGSAVYDRRGKLVYYPQWFDNGNDYWSEGLRRYVEGDKMGFVNK